jgi:hypothetical protein
MTERVSERATSNGYINFDELGDEWAHVLPRRANSPFDCGIDPTAPCAWYSAAVAEENKVEKPALRDLGNLHGRADVGELPDGSMNPGLASGSPNVSKKGCSRDGSFSLVGASNTGLGH